MLQAIFEFGAPGEVEASLLYESRGLVSGSAPRCDGLVRLPRLLVAVGQGGNQIESFALKCRCSERLGNLDTALSDVDRGGQVLQLLATVSRLDGTEKGLIGRVRIAPLKRPVALEEREPVLRETQGVASAFLALFEHALEIITPHQ